MFYKARNNVKQSSLPWKTIGAKTILSSVLRNGGSRELQAKAWVACMSSKYFSVEISVDVIAVVVVVAFVDTFVVVVVVAADLTDTLAGALVTHWGNITTTVNRKAKNNFWCKKFLIFLELFVMTNEDDDDGGCDELLILELLNWRLEW